MPSANLHNRFWAAESSSCNTFQAGKTLVTNARVDAHNDNMAFLQSLEKEGDKNV